LNVAAAIVHITCLVSRYKIITKRRCSVVVYSTRSAISKTVIVMQDLRVDKKIQIKPMIPTAKCEPAPRKFISINFK
jgi:hypothetical protein